MQKCKTCGKDIKYIATVKGENVICDAIEIIIYTDFGRKVKGYKVHECEQTKDNS